MTFEKTFKSLCNPARLYLGLSVVIILIVLLNILINGPNALCMGIYNCSVSHVALFFILKFLYIGFWTWLLNFLCSHGLKTLSWVLVLIPIFIFFIGIALITYAYLEGGKIGTKMLMRMQKQHQQNPTEQSQTGNIPMM